MSGHGDPSGQPLAADPQPGAALMPRRLVVVYGVGAATAVDIMARHPQGVEVVIVAVRSWLSQDEETLLGHLGVTHFTDTADEHALFDVVAPLSPDGVMTFSEPLLMATSHVARRLGLTAHSLEASVALHDKVIQRERLAGGPGAVRQALVRSVDEWDAATSHVGLPCVVKPRSGFASQHTTLVRNTAQGIDAIREILEARGDAVAEEYLVGEQPGRGGVGDYVSVETVSAGGDVLFTGVTGKFPLVPPFRETGEFLPSTMDPVSQASVEYVCRDALARIGVRDGVCHTEIKLTLEGPRVIEVNGRLGGLVGELHRRATGIDLVTAGMAVALGLIDAPIAVNRIDGTFASFSNLAPVGAARLIDVFGQEDMRGSDTLTSYNLLVRPGASLMGNDATDALDVMHVHATDHQAACDALLSVLDLVRFQFEMVDGAVTEFTGSQLPSTVTLHKG